MNRLPSFVRQHLVALRGLLVFTVLTGIAYPLVMLAVAQVGVPPPGQRLTGQLQGPDDRVQPALPGVRDREGRPLPQYFQPRPSAATSGASNDYGCNPLFSGASNLGPNNPALVQDIKQRQTQIAAFDHVKVSAIPPDAVTASASGLDPYISPANAAIQVDRVAAARHIEPGAGAGAGQQVHPGPHARLPG